jgi:hypothetical protein
MLVSPPGKRSLSSACTFVESASAGRKLEVSSLVTSASLEPIPPKIATSNSQNTTMAYLPQRCVTSAASLDMGAAGYKGVQTLRARTIGA